MKTAMQRSWLVVGLVGLWLWLGAGQAVGQPAAGILRQV